jgi:hypothetical protein
VMLRHMGILPSRELAYGRVVTGTDLAQATTRADR